MSLWQSFGLRYFANSELPFILIIGVVWWGLYFLLQRKRKKPYLFVLFLTIFYGFLTFYQLGSSAAPQSAYQNIAQETVTFDFGTKTTVDSIYLYSSQGAGNTDDPFRIYTREVEIFTSNDRREWTRLGSFDKRDYMKWLRYDLHSEYRYAQIRFQNSPAIIDEIGFYQEESKRFITPTVIAASRGEEAAKLIDEQELLHTDITYLDETYFDEIYHVRNAYEINNNYLLYTAVHPLLGTRGIALGIRLFGANPFGYRFFGACCSILLVPLFFFLAKEVFGKERYGNIAALLFCLDFMHFTTGRIATLEPFSLFWILAMYLFMMKFLHTFLFYDWQKATLYLCLSGLCMSAAWATKWTGIYASLALAVLYFYTLYKHYVLAPKGRRCNKILFYYLLVAFIFFAIIPFYVYLFSYYGLRIYPEKPNDIFAFAAQIGRYTQYAFTYHQNLVSHHPFAAPWYMWLLNVRPIWYYVGYGVREGISVIQSISCFNNPAINLYGIFVLLQIIFRKQYKLPKNFMPLTAYLLSLVVWFPIQRETFAYHYYPSIPFLILLIVSYLEEIEKHHSDSRFPSFYLLITAILFVVFLPVISGYTTLRFYVQNLIRWLPTWYFG